VCRLCWCGGVVVWWCMTNMFNVRTHMCVGCVGVVVWWCGGVVVYDKHV